MLLCLAAGCSEQRTPATPSPARVEESGEVKSLRAMKVGDRFPIERWIPPSRQDESWTVAQIARARSQRPVSGASSQTPCEAVAVVMEGHDGELLSWAALALICDGQIVEMSDPEHHLWALRTDLIDGEVHLELRFIEALEPGREILWLSTYEFGKRQHFTVQELLARVKADRFDLLMDSNCLTWFEGQVPRRLLGTYANARAAYRAQFDGPFPRAFIFESNEGRGFSGAKVSFTPGVGYGDDLSLLDGP
jgi:hypothetical protein